MSLNNKVALITGSGSGIGAAAALLFAKEGAHVVIVDKFEVGANNIGDQIKEIGKIPFVIAADITKDKQVQEIIKKVIDKFGKLDILINNAGIIKSGGILDGTIMGTFDLVMNTNIRATVQMTSVAAPFLVETKGCVVNISSVAAFIAKSAMTCASYCVSKAGVHAFTQAAAFELAASGVRVNSIAPGPVATNIYKDAGIQFSPEDILRMVPLQKISYPSEIADLLLYLVSDKAKSITGSCFVIDNGMMLM